MSVFTMLRRLAFRGLAVGRSRWWAVPVLAAALSVVVVVGGGGVADAAPPTVSVTGVGAAAPVLRQAGSMWETTVLVTDSSGCAKAASIQYWLAATASGGSPGGAFGGPVTPGSVVAATSDASACEVTVAFSGPARVPATAALVADQSGTTATVALTVSRDVTVFSYLGWPAIAGGVAVALYMLGMLSVATWDWRGARRYRLVSGEWWKHPVAGSGAWSAGDSWATNISTGVVLVGTVLAATTASSALFPGVALDRFAIVNIVAGVFVVAAPLLFGILYTFFTGRDAGPSADSVVRVHPSRQVVLRVPSGAAVTMVAETTVSGGGVPAHHCKAGDSYQVPPGSVIAIKPAGPGAAGSGLAGAIALSGTSDVGVLPGACLFIGPEPAEHPVFPYGLPLRASLAGGAKITVTGTADVNLPEGAVITGPRRKDSRPARADRWLLVPQGTTVIVGSLGIMVAANILTMFGIGAEVGIALVLASLSEAAGAGQPASTPPSPRWGASCSATRSPRPGRWPIPSRDRR